MSSEIEERKFTFIWRIENFSYCTQREGEFLSSPTFVINTPRKTEWFLNLYPRGKTDKNFVSCYLQRVEYDDGPASVSMTCQLSALGVDGTRHNSAQINSESVDRASLVGVNQFVKRNDVIKYKKNVFLSEDILTICFHMWNVGLLQSVRCEARTRFGIEKRCFNWIIEDYGYRQNNEQLSTPVPSTSSQPFSLRINFAPHDESEYDGKLHFGIVNYVEWAIFLTCKISVVDVDGNSGFLAKAEHLFAGKDTWKFPAFTTRAELLNRRSVFLPNGHLNLRCEIVLSDGVKLNHIENSTFGAHSSQAAYLNVSGVSSIAEDHANLRDDLYCLYSEKKFCDLTLNVAGETFPVHKAVLIARSPIFSSVLNIRDGIPSSVIDIPDLDPDIMSRMLVFIYSDTLENLEWRKALQLYSAADKYQIYSLKKQASKFLIASLSEENVCEILVLADSMQDPYLKMAAQEFVFVNDHKIIPSPEWQRFVGTKHKIAAEAMQYIYSKRMKVDT